jgi:hypothetical protein
MFATSQRSDQTREHTYRDVHTPASGLNQFVPVIVPQPGLCLTLPVWTRIVGGAR